MKTIVLMFDSLNRHLLSPYGCQWTHTPNFSRLAAKALTFDQAYVCSMPCMPARRDLHTGRPNFYHRSWGPLEPFDDSVFEILRKNGVSSHIVTDHYHYWEDGGAGYLQRYDTARFFRGQEGDAWMGQVEQPAVPPNMNGKGREQDWVNRQFLREDTDYPQSKTIDAGLDFIQRNYGSDNWILQIETFDPHEPFTVADEFQAKFPVDDPVLFDWPPYAPVSETAEQVEQARRRYAALLAKCDHSLGKVLDAMDDLDLWDDTCLVVCTDHGFMLGEHGWWAKNEMPLYQEIANTPFFVWDPRSRKSGRCQSLAQPMLDLGPTLLGLYGLAPTPRMTGKDLAPAIRDGAAVREYAVFGYHGLAVNVTDGRFVYMHSPATGENQPLSNFTLMPTIMRGYLPHDELARAELVPGAPWTQDLPVLKIPTARSWSNTPCGESRFFDLDEDPAQENSLSDHEAKERLLQAIVADMQLCEAPEEQYVRLGLESRSR